jgi:predicted metal-dependent phosphoesterase TrpH
MTAPEALVDDVVAAAQLDVIAITDHDEVAGALAARAWAARQGYAIEVVCGVEVTTRDGHLLALGIEERPTALRPAVETAAWVVAHGGVCVAPHPFTHLTHALGRRALDALVANGLLVGVEVLNASLAGRGSRRPALAFAAEHRLARVGASDAHMLSMIGLARTTFPGRDAAALWRALAARQTDAEGRFARPSELATEALPQLGRALVELPLRRVVRLAQGH